MSESLEPIAVATQQGGAEITENGICPTITAAAGMSGNNQPWICKPESPISFHLLQDPITSRERTPCIGTGNSANGQASIGVCYEVTDKHILDDQGGSQINVRTDGKSPTLRAEMHGNVPCVMDAVGLDGYNSTLTGDKAATLGVNCGMSTGRNGVLVAAGFKAGQSMAGGIGWQEECAATLSAECSGTEPTVCIKTWDARGNGDGETVSTITGDHENRITDYTSLVVEPVAYNGENITSPLNKTNPQPGDPCHTLGTDSRNYVVITEVVPVYVDTTHADDVVRLDDVVAPLQARDHKGGKLVCQPIPIHDQATRFSGKRGDKSDGKGNGLGIGNPGDAMNTLTAGDRHAVAYAMQGFGDYKESPASSGLKARDYKDATDLVVESYGADCRNMNEYPELYPTLQAKPNGGQSLNFSGAVRTTIPEEKGVSEPMVRYIVRRLTPTECARLQGFPDKWGHPDKKEDFTEEEYQFWLNVRNTHAAINDKAVKEYTKAQMLTWYNKLHTDSSEYKMWGNGISLSTSLYMMQGIADALLEEM